MRGVFSVFSPERGRDIWLILREETQKRAQAEPVLASMFHGSVLSHDSFSTSLSHILANLLQHTMLPAVPLCQLIEDAYGDSPDLALIACEDLQAARAGDPACRHYSTPLLFYKGYHALQGHRIANWLWRRERHSIALYLQGRISQVLNVDIHPAARIGSGVFIDHGSGVVIGETCVVEDHVMLYQGVTLGGTGKEQGDRHPKVRHGALVASGAKVLGNVEIGRRAKVAAGSVVLSDVAEGVTVAGVPAREVGQGAENRDIARWAERMNCCELMSLNRSDSDNTIIKEG